MKKQIIAWMVLAVLATTWAYTYATNNSTGSVTKNEIMDIVKKARDWVTLTTDEQTKLDAVKSKKYSKTWSGKTMFSHDKRKGFPKMIENKAKQEARENLIDKLLAGQTLTSDEETIRAEIIKERAEMKAKKAEIEAKMAKMKTIMEKKKAGTTLTTEEQAVLDSMKSNMQKWKMWKWEFRGR